MTYTYSALEPLARDVGYNAEPYRWDESRRQTLQAELDACFLHMADIARSDVEHLLDSFRVLREQEEKAHGEFRTRRLVLEAYDALLLASNGSDPTTETSSPAMQG